MVKGRDNKKEEGKGKRVRKEGYLMERKNRKKEEKAREI